MEEPVVFFVDFFAVREAFLAAFVLVDGFAGLDVVLEDVFLAVAEVFVVFSVGFLDVFCVLVALVPVLTVLLSVVGIGATFGPGWLLAFSVTFAVLTEVGWLEEGFAVASLFVSAELGAVLGWLELSADFAVEFAIL